MMDPVFAMDETFSHASGSRLVRRCDLTSVMQREHADEQRNFACQAHFLPHLGRCQRETISVSQLALLASPEWHCSPMLRHPSG